MNVPWICLGLLFDTFSLFCIVGQTVGFSDRPGLPIGPFFYFIGFFIMLIEKQLPVYLSILVFVCCIMFFLFVIFSGVLVHNCIKFIRRYKAVNKWIFVSNALSPVKVVIDRAMCHLTNNHEAGHEGFVYLKQTKKFRNRAVVHLLSSGELEIQVAQLDPGYIKDGYFAKELLSSGFSIENWRIGKWKQLIVPPEDHNRVPSFIDLLYKEIYEQGDNNEITAEVFLLP